MASTPTAGSNRCIRTRAGPTRFPTWSTCSIWAASRRAGAGDETVLVLTAEEVHTLKTMADAYSFDYEEGFIEMCLEMALFADQLVGGEGDGEVRFTANF